MMALRCASAVGLDDWGVGAGGSSSRGAATPMFMRGLRGALRIDEPMSRHTSWRVGGAAEYMYTPADKADAIRLLRQLPVAMPLYWLGLGSNLLVRDGGVGGLVVRTGRAPAGGEAAGLSAICIAPPHYLEAQAGVPCAKVARVAAAHGLGGVEFLAGVPGSFGGALAMNAGAFGGETWDWVEYVECVDRHGGTRIFSATEIDAGYRRVDLPPQHGLLGGRLALQPAAVLPAREVSGGAASGDVARHRPTSHGQQRIRELLEKRHASQPVQSANAGSVFRNPPGDFAARLVQSAGLRGACIGDAVISDIHANFIINRGAATAAHIEALMHHAQREVQRATGVDLALEVRIIGRPA